MAAVAAITVAEAINAIRVRTNRQTRIDASAWLGDTMSLGSSHSLVVSTGTHA